MLYKLNTWQSGYCDYEAVKFISSNKQKRSKFMVISYMPKE